MEKSESYEIVSCCEVIKIPREFIEKTAELFWNEIVNMRDLLERFNRQFSSFNAIAETEDDQASRESISTARFLSKMFLSVGFRQEDLDRLFNAVNKNEIISILEDAIDFQNKTILEYLENNNLKERLIKASENLNNLFALVGSKKKDCDCPVFHAGSISKVILNLKKDNFSSNYWINHESGEYFSDLGFAVVYYDIRMTPEMLLHVYVHEKTHRYADENFINEDVTNGFASFIKHEGKKRVDFNALNEGMTELISRKACYGMVDYSVFPNGGMYEDYVQNILSIADRIAKFRKVERDEIISEMMRIYSESESVDRIIDFLRENGVSEEEIEENRKMGR